MVASILTGLRREQTGALAKEAPAARKTGRLAALCVIAFSMMAEILSASRIARGRAKGLFGRWALIASVNVV